MLKEIAEGMARILVPEETKISKKLPVFYNPAMKRNRDLSVLLVKSLERKDMRLLDPLAGTGVRSIRLLLEAENSVVEILANDGSLKAFETILENIGQNKLSSDERIKASNLDANLFMRQNQGMDYIDIDPFGYPGPFLDSAIAGLARNGIIAVTATDTSALAGSSPRACQRKYWAKPLRDHAMHETGLRILIRFVQLIGAMHERALQPILSYYEKHYMRAFFLCEKGKEKVDKLISRHGMSGEAGPLWTGILQDKNLLEKMIQNSRDTIEKNFISQLLAESEIETVGFFAIPKLCKKYKLHKLESQDIVIKKIQKAGYLAARTHFNPEGIRSNITEEELVGILKQG